MKTIIDINSWKRKEHFDFFSSFDEPFFGIITEIDCTRAYSKAKLNGGSFFLYYIHKSLIAANLIEEFRYRLDNNQLVLFDKIHASPTIGREDETFAFSFF